MQAALIQLCMDVQNDKTSQWSFSEQAILLSNLNSILTPRLKMLDRVYQDPPYKTIPGTFDWTLEQTKVMISQELHPMCTSHSCSCFGNERANIQDLVCFGNDNFGVVLNSYLSSGFAVVGIIYCLT